MKFEQEENLKEQRESASLLRDVPHLSNGLRSLFSFLPTHPDQLAELERLVAEDLAEAEHYARTKISFHSPSYDEEERVLREAALDDLAVHRALLACIQAMGDTIKNFPPRGS